MLPVWPVPDSARGPRRGLRGERAGPGDPGHPCAAVSARTSALLSRWRACLDPAADRTFDPDRAAEIVWFDAYITNVDRTARNTNLLRWHDADVYDRSWGVALFPPPSGRVGEGATARFPQIKDHVLLPFAGILPPPVHGSPR